MTDTERLVRKAQLDTLNDVMNVIESTGQMDADDTLDFVISFINESRNLLKILLDDESNG
ncbi:hypothetical protein DSECCO2_120530 [anaerobic digester metagenome]